MKKLLLIITMACAVLTSCKKDNQEKDADDDSINGEFLLSNEQIDVYIVDQHGNNLLDPKTPHALNAQEIRVYKYTGPAVNGVMINNPFVDPQYRYGYDLSTKYVSLFADKKVRVEWEEGVSDIFEASFIEHDNYWFIKDFSVNGKLIYQQTDPNEIFHSEPYTYTRVILR